jgi:hypothetical protein
MSRRPGNSPHSARAATPDGFVVAPHRGQLGCEGSIGAPHQAHFDVAVAIGAAGVGGGLAAAAAARFTAPPHPPQKFAPSGTGVPQ